MSVSIHLDQHNEPFYTNLDFISGRVILNLNTDFAVSAINVKLEGESKTRLAGPRNPNDRPEKVKTELELHKLLYKIQTVFPSQDLLRNVPGGNPQYTLASGHYEYPFRFKFPFNNDCKASINPFQDLKIGGLNVQLTQLSQRHVKRALPPTLGGFPGEAEIKYYIKVTVVRPKFYQENIRAQSTLTFLPIEPPRPENRHEEQYARRLHQFTCNETNSKLGLFQSAAKYTDESLPNVKVDARLPSPPILTCQQTIPLRVIVEKVNDSSANLYLTMFHLELVGYTNVKAQGLERTERSNWILTSKANMDMVLDNPEDKKSKQLQIPPRLWETILIPNTVVPTFETCNLSRRYEFEVRVGLSHSMADGTRPEQVILPLCIPCKVYSGLKPPPELLTRLQAQDMLPSSNVLSSPAPSSSLSSRNDSVSLTPSSATHGYAHTPVAGVPQANHSVHDDMDDLPPSYEDAIAEDIGPVDGPRQHFEAQQAAQRQEPAYSGDSKSSGGLNRHPSERLFAQNAPRPPGPSMAASLKSNQTNTLHEEPAEEATPGLAQASTDATTEISSATAQLDLAGSTADDGKNENESLPPPLPARRPAGTS